MPNEFRRAVRRIAVVDNLCNGTSGAPQLERHLATAVLDAFDIFQDRQLKYGPNNIAKRREKGLITRIDDKLTRLARVYLEGSTDMPDESIEDTWIDLANYALIGLLCHRGHWPQYQTTLFKEDADANGGT
jgi:hypothetical protein